MIFADLPDGTKFTEKNRQTIYVKVDECYAKELRTQKQRWFYDNTSALEILTPERENAIKTKRMWARARNDAMRSVGLVKTPYGWE